MSDSGRCCDECGHTVGHSRKCSKGIGPKEDNDKAWDLSPPHREHDPLNEHCPFNSSNWGVCTCGMTYPQAVAAVRSKEESHDGVVLYHLEAQHWDLSHWSQWLPVKSSTNFSELERIAESEVKRLQVNIRFRIVEVKKCYGT